jgi:aspartyl-tRNA(Asn)/glutamyl-tRNA(Gln) amidotransferase subunit A
MSEALYSQELVSSHISQILKNYQEKKISISQYVENVFNYIEKVNPKLNAVTSVQKEAALKRANELDQRSAQPQEFLYGVPFIIKENIQKINFPVECASALLKGYRGQYDATSVTLLEKAGAIIIATANMDEFAMGSSNEHSAHGPVFNPHDLSRSPGGSSGGSAASCCAGFVPVTLGSDTGGSVREPAAFCGIYGFKPSYGRVSRFGLVAFGSSLDQISPFARCAADLDLTMRAIGQYDERDATSLSDSYMTQLNKLSIKGKKIGVIRHLLKNGVDKNVLDEFHKLEQKLTGLGVEFVDVDVSTLDYTLSAYYVIASAEASSNLSRFDGIRYGSRTHSSSDLNQLYAKTRSEGFGKEVKRRILLGTFALSAGYYDAYYGRAQAVREKMIQEFDALFEKVDFIYLPTAPCSAFKIGESSQDPLKEYLIDIFTIPANLARITALSVPASVAPGELPVGLQFMAARGKDAHLIAFAHELEKAKLIGTTPLA